MASPEQRFLNSPRPVVEELPVCAKHNLPASLYQTKKQSANTGRCAARSSRALGCIDMTMRRTRRALRASAPGLPSRRARLLLLRAPARRQRRGGAASRRSSARRRRRQLLTIARPHFCPW
jgi:hypothetical protein